MMLVLTAITPTLHAQPAVTFTHVTVDASGPLDPWGKAIGDINGDGKIDLVVGGYTSGGLVWYENPSWIKHTVSTRAGFRTDHQVRDIDRDGRNDIVSLGADASGSPVLEWFKNPGSTGTWTATIIAQQTLHDVEVADLDGDGKFDCVARDQQVFGSGHGDVIYVYIQKTPASWTAISFPCANGEGLKVADINRDGKPDIIINGTWFENLGNGTAWAAHSYTSTYTHPSVTVDVADINGDGRVDIVLAPAETIGGTYRISWFEAPATPSQSGWTEHIIENNVETDHHSIGTGDFNNDGLMDIATAAQHTGASPQQVEVLLNGGGGLTWKKVVLATTGSHNMHIADFDNDGDLDIFGANWEGRQVDLWVNTFALTGPLPIELSALTATQNSGHLVTIGWTTLSETNNYGFSVQMKQAGELEFAGIANSFVAGHGTTILPHSYTYTVPTAVNPLSSFRLEQLDLDNSIRFSEAVMSHPVGVPESSPVAFGLNQNFPNPFNPSTTIRYGLFSTSQVTLTLFNTLGQNILTLVNAVQDAGYHEAKLDVLR
jgi:hypothetical protein